MKKIILSFLSFFIALIVVLSSCHKELGQIMPGPPPQINVNGNRSPLANAGVDQIIVLPNNVVTLD
ncbi:MAG: hypothetical protein ABIU11_02160, partial [Chitinophagaceae bacterium]